MLFSRKMNGSLARRGFRFQDLHSFTESLTEIGKRFADKRSINLERKRIGESRFGIEVGTDADRAPDWDNVIEYVDRVEVIEAKSGDVSDPIGSHSGNDYAENQDLRRSRMFARYGGRSVRRRYVEMGSTRQFRHLPPLQHL